MKYINDLKGVVLFTVLMFLSACDSQNTTQKLPAQTSEKDVLYQAFNTWKSQQDPKLIQEYQEYLAQHLQHPPSLFELTFNAHIHRPECLQYRFALADKSQWKNVVKPLKLIEKLQTQGLIENYKITSIYRDKQSNECGKGASASKHLGNYAVDFQVLDVRGQPYAKEDLSIQKKLCAYWKTQGYRDRLGLGTYLNHKFHVDVQGFRTWGYTYKRASSACL